MDAPTAGGWIELLTKNVSGLLALIVVIETSTIYWLFRALIAGKDERIAREQAISTLIMAHTDKFREAFELLKGAIGGRKPDAQG